MIYEKEIKCESSKICTKINNKIFEIFWAISETGFKEKLWKNGDICKLPIKLLLIMETKKIDNLELIKIYEKEIKCESNELATKINDEMYYIFRDIVMYGFKNTLWKNNIKMKLPIKATIRIELDKEKYEENKQRDMIEMDDLSDGDVEEAFFRGFFYTKCECGHFAIDHVMNGNKECKKLTKTYSKCKCKKYKEKVTKKK